MAQYTIEEYTAAHSPPYRIALTRQAGNSPTINRPLVSRSNGTIADIVWYSKVSLNKNSNIFILSKNVQYLCGHKTQKSCPMSSSQLKMPHLSYVASYQRYPLSSWCIQSCIINISHISKAGKV